MKRFGAALLMAGMWAIFGLIVWYFYLWIDLRADPKLFAVGGAVIGFIMVMLRLGEDNHE